MLDEIGAVSTDQRKKMQQQTRSNPESYASYQSKFKAFEKGLVAFRGDLIYIGPDYRTVLSPRSAPGRETVRLESKKRYNHGLLIARIPHEPKIPYAACGTLSNL